ncbi:non-ribosomal peptide synthase/polyketide synthase [Chitinophaga oryzae]|uniref:Non-ribosomal peptide synthase/polyketide synthase n=1 Tax=Chitinophaga oryzae TaxID=2725414 RepID=A0AAE7D738_9BACT|nr:non-ribosomal peptide synthase/polyketide synthase [Chitinophaga oryzae]QJB31967.1 non-ribosomal peptide synthase/polyketide synthase [Chitinophaga oryzae]
MFDFNLNEIIDLLNEAHDSGIKVSFEDDNLLVEADEDKEIDAGFLDRLRNNKNSLIAYFKKHKSGTQEKHFSGSIRDARDNDDGPVPLSFSQDRLWFIHQLEGSVQYHIPAALRLKGKLDVAALNFALRTVVNRHEVLRTVIHQADGNVWQRVLEKDQWQLDIIDGTSGYEKPEVLQAYMDELVQIPFDLFHDHMLRAHLIQLAPEEFLLVLVMHHIASDGWSTAILVNELNEAYTAATEKREPVLEPLDIQFADYAVWQRKYLAGDMLDKQLSYWKKQLDGASLLNLPTDYERPAVKSTRGALVTFHIPQQLTAALEKLSQEQGATLYMTLLAAFKVLLYRYSGQEDISIGGVVAGRMRTEMERLIGFFVNTLVLRTHLDGNPDFITLLQQVKNTLLDAYEHQEVPFEKVVEAVMGERDISKNPLFQVVFVLQNVPPTKELKMGEVVMQDEKIMRTTSLFDLSWSMEQGPDGIDVEVEYYTDIFTEATIQRMVGHFQLLLQAAADNPAQSIGTLNMLSEAEKHQLQVSFNDTATLYPSAESVVSIFEGQVAFSPQAPAVTFGKRTLTYRELDEQANQVANYLAEQGMQPGNTIALLSRRGIEMIVAIWGILKSGNAYAPFHTGYPADRLHGMMEDAGITTLLYTSRELFISSGMGEFTTGLDIAAARNSAVTPPGIRTGSDACINVMYTSGTTGRPKGIAITNRNIINLAFDRGATSVLPGDRLLQCSNYAFDGSTFDIYSALLNGACLCMVEDDAAIDVFELARIIAAEKITIALFPTALFHNFIDNQPLGLKPMRKILFGGEKASLPHLEKALAVLGQGKLVNMYGPTEVTVAATCYEVNDVTGRQSVPIGTPMANARIRILDENRQLVPLGVSGEIYVGGDGVSLGYVNREDLTAEKYVTLEDAPGRWYRTGDKGRWLPDGTIAYAGRIDDQVKIRGYRIEPGEIERALNNLPEVGDSCVVVKQQHTGEKRLVSYFVPEQETLQQKEYELSQLQIASWRALYDTAYSKTDEIEDLDEEFNITGWNDSFTSGPIPAENMQQWVNDITNLIIGLRPKRVLEIGSGTGLIYYPIADHIERYIGTDFSRVSVEQILRRIAKGERRYPDTEMKLCAAHEIILDEKEEIDLVILNSIVQYFPGAAYMTDVLAKAITLLKGKGRIVVGDVRDLRLLPSFKRRLQLDKLHDKTSVREFEWSVEQEVLKEEELCFSPAYFYHLQTRFPEITNVEIVWKQGDYINELSLYRYTVILHVGIEKPVLQPEWQPWDAIADKSTIIDQLTNRIPVIALQDVPGHRVWRERMLDHALKNNLCNNVGDLSDYISAPDKVTHTVNEILDEAMAAGYSCRFLLDEDPLKINLLIERERFDGFVEQSYSNSISFADTVKTNVPLFTDICEALQKNIKQQLLDRLPDYMVPADFVALQKLPLTGNGKVDRKFLAAWEDIQRKRLINYVAPTNATEQHLAGIWQHLLGVERVGIEDNFFELGGHSLLATRVVAAVRKDMDVELTVKDFFIYPTIALLAAYLQQQEKGSHLPPLVAGPRPANIPLSFSQERLWFIDQLQGTVPYHMPVILRLHGNLDVQGLEFALRNIVNGHEVLRTVIAPKDGVAWQHVMDKDQWQLTLVPQSPELSDEATLKQLLSGLADMPFDLCRDHMLRAHLVTLSAQEHLLLLTIHHIACDGWSISILVKELVELYRAYAEKRAPILEKPEIQYADYALWQRNSFDGAVLGEKMKYWKQQLNNVQPLDLPTDYARPAVQQFNGAISWFHLDQQLTDQLQQLSREQGVTLFMTLLTAFKVLLQRYSGQDDICVGSPVSGRTQQETEGLIGFFLNTVALRADLSDNPSFLSLLQQVKNTTLDAYEHQQVPFEKIVEEVVKDRDMSRSPLYQAMFVLQNTPPVPELLLGDLHLAYEEVPHKTTLCDITMSLEEQPDGIRGYAEYCTDLFSAGRIKQMMKHFEQLLRAIVAAPASEINMLRITTAAEEEQLLSAFNSRIADYPRNKTIIDLFDRQVLLTPEAVAVVFESVQVTYGELNSRANQLAHYLRKLGVREDTLVPVFLERSEQMIIAMLGILKAGGAYVPIDPEYPQERVRFMLTDTAAQYVVSNSESAHLLEGLTSATIVSLDADQHILKGFPEHNPESFVQPHHLAYVIYTSGSTGQPKGVLLEHYNVVRLFETDTPLYDFNSSDVWTLFHSICFDFSVWEMYGALFYGGRLVIVSKQVAKDASLFGQLLLSEGVTVLNQTPAAFYVLQEYLVAHAPAVPVRYVIFGGEALNPAMIRPWKEAYPHCRTINMYGITETTVHVTYQEIGVEHLQSSSSIIGTAIPTLGIYILDANRSLSPVGVPGELYVSGAGLARGYLNREALTAERFLPNPFSREGDYSRLYKTGDQARWLADGNIEYLGRIDQQVKIRGYRIELGEIENVLLQSGFIKQAVVVATNDSAGSKILAAYIVSEERFDRERVIAVLKERLPDYMVPALFITLDKMPLTSNGKIDRKALPDVHQNAPAGNEYVAPRNDMEQLLADVWQELLQVPRVGVYDNFFELGGHSLLSMRMVAVLRKKIAVELTVRSVFLYPVIAQLAAFLQEEASQTVVPGIKAVKRPARIPLSFAQERLWFIDQLEGSVQYHVPAVLRLRGSLDVEALSTALRSVVNRHEILRTVIRQNDGRGYQYILDQDNWTLNITDQAAYKENPAALQEFIKKITDAPFDLSADHMLRADLVVQGPDEHILIITTHHIASDAWSTGILVKELVAFYMAAAAGTEAHLEKMAIQYADYAIWQRTYITGDILDKQLAYWKENLAGITPLNLPLDYPRPPVRSTRGGAVSFQLPAELTAQLHQFSRQEGVSLFMTLFSAFNVMLYRYSGQEDICVGSPVAGRTQQEVEGLIGFFINMLALRVDLSRHPSFRALLHQVKQTTLNAFEHQEVPFEKIVDQVVVDNDRSHRPVFQVVFGLQNNVNQPDLQFGDIVLSEETVAHTSAKFDLVFSMDEDEDGLNGTVVYCADLFTEATVKRMVGHFQQLLQAVVTSPDQQIGLLPMLTSGEEQQLLAVKGNYEKEYTQQITFADLFEAQANRSPEAIAVAFENNTLTYRELNERANCLAHYLRSRRVKAGTLVPVCMERSLDMVVSILGILKAGGAYVPVEPDFPEDRIRFMLEDTDASNIITLSKYADRVQAVPADIILLDDDWNDIKVNGKENIPGITRAEHPVYVIYTSGSTGQPKGVVVTHGNLADYIAGLTNALPLKECRSFGLMSSMATDLGNTVIFGALANGGALHIFSKEMAQDTTVLYEYLDRNPIDCIKIVPSHWKALCLPDRLLIPEKLLIFGGEALESAVAASVYATGTACTVVNHYGPTETTIGKLLHIVDRDAAYGESIPVGKPFSATQVYVLSQELQLCPVGVPGALYIGGEGVASGYLNNDELTAAKFIADPFAPGTNGRLYSTGDMVKYLPDGNILFMGRVDDQVKIRGYRIELGEIERALNSCATVKQAVVVVKKDHLDNKRLVAYVVAEADADVDKEEILQQLTEQLPDYMVPSLLMVLDYFPLLANGKVDKKALPEADGSSLQTDTYVAPRNEVERTLAGIWEALLGVERVGINDNFFALGGDSIITIQVVSRVRRAGYELQVGDLFDYQTIAMLYAVMSARKGAATAVSADQEIQSGSCGLLPVQQWYFEKEGTTPSHFNQSMLLKIDKRIPSSTLSAAIMQLVQYHDSLRFKYTYGANRWEQTYGNAEAMLNIVNLQAESMQEFPEMMVTYGNGYQRSIDVTKGNCISAVLFLTPAGDAHNRLLLAVHHLVVDGVSWRILLEDLERLIDGLYNNQTVSLGKKSSSYRQWYDALVKYSGTERLLKQADYWSGMVQQYRPLPVDKAYDGVLRIKDMQHYQVKLTPLFTQQLLQEVPAAYRTEINDVLLSALALTLNSWTDGAVLIGLEGHGREDIDSSVNAGDTVGWFTSLYPVLLPGHTTGDAGMLLRNMKEQLRQVPDKGIGFGVLKYLNKLAALQGGDPWDITFNYLGQFDAVTSGGKWFSVTDEPAGAEAGDDYTVRRKIAVNSMVTGGELVLDWSFSHQHYNIATITTLAQQYIDRLEAIIRHAVAQAAQQPLLTPSDYGLGGLVSNTELDRFLDMPMASGAKRRDEMTAMYRLSGLQEGMLFHGLYDNAVDAYTEQFTYLLHQTDISAFIESWEYLLQRHTILRSAFYHDAFHVPVQCVYRYVQLPVTQLDFRHLDAAAQEAAWTAHEAEVLQQPFDFTAPPLMKMSLIRLQDDTWRMVWTYHHLLLDGWSMPVLLEELLRTYEALASGKQPEETATDHYEEYIRYLDRRNKDEEGAYWRGYLADISNSTLLPFISSADRTKAEGRYKTTPVVLDATQTKLITSYAQQQRLTVNTLMQGVWGYLLYRYTGNQHVAYGAIVSGRPDDMPGIERKVGMYINTLPVHIAVTPEQPITDWLRDIQAAQVQSRKYQYTPLRDSQRYTGVTGDLFDTLMVYENYPVDEETLSYPWKLQIEQLHVEEHTNYPLSITIGVGQEITILLQHNTALLSPGYITQISEHFKQVLEYIVRNPAAKTADIVLLNNEERERIAVTFNKAALPQATTGKSAVDLFKERVALAPQQTAVVFETQALTYGELDKRSDQLALYLVSKGVQQETLVPVCVERSPEMVVAILAILKAGGGYLPIDPSYPAARISYLLEDSRATMMISSTEVADRLDIPAHIHVIKTDADQAAIAEQPGISLSTTPAPDDLAYVIYTSGSTGQPKGVMIEHKGLVNLALNMETVLSLRPGIKVLQFSAFGFDASCFEIFSTLLSGGCLVIPHKDDLLSAEKFGEMVRQHEVELLLLPPSYQHTIREELGTIKTIISGGEALNREDTRYFQSKGIRVFNAYGPTENSVITTITDSPLQGDTVVIGKPLANGQVYILDAQGELCPVGVAGEICAGGVGVARGYLYRPALTTEKFIPDHFSEQPGARLYRTGDLGRWLPDGNIEYLGRIDDQVKIRGYRIEPGEIENALLQSGFVTQAVVLVKTDDNGHKRLVAYVVPQGAFDKEPLLTSLKDKLPPYMVPSLVVPLEKILVTANGKVDKAALPEPYTTATHTRAVLNGEVEQTLAVIWEELLGVKNIGRNDNFFELGGDSIITIQVVGRAKRFGYDLKPKDLFVHQTIAGLAASLASGKEKAVRGEQGILTGDSGLTPIQQWYLEEETIAKHFIQQLFVGIDKQVSDTVLNTAIQQLLLRHDALRFTYTRKGGQWQQHYGSYAGALEVVDLREVAADEYAATLAAHCDRYQASLQPEEGILLRAVLFLTAPSEAANRLLIIGHHLAVDGVSWQIMQDDLELLLDQLQRNEPVMPPLKTSSYREWHQALVAYGQRKQLQQQREYWVDIAQQYQPLKVDKAYHGALTGNDMATHEMHLDAALTQLLLQEAPKAYHTEINDVLLAALSAALYAWNGAGVVVGLEGHGREDIASNIDISNTVGWFTSLYPVGLSNNVYTSPGALLKAVKEQLRQLPDKGIGYGVLKYINKEEALQGRDPWDITFNYLGQVDAARRNSKWFSTVPEAAGTGSITDVKIRHKIAVNGAVENGELILYWSYSTHHYNSGTIQELVNNYQAQLQQLIYHAVAQATVQPVFTPSDYGLGHLVTNAELDQFLDAPHAGGGTRRDHITGLYRLSSLQEGMLFHGLYNGNNGVYIQQLCCTLDAPDIAVLKDSWRQLLQHHTVLRSSFFANVFRIPVQCVQAQVVIPFDEQDYRHLDAAAQEEAWTAYEAADLVKGFDFTAPPLMRIALIRLTDERYRMVWTFHHLLLDGWSGSVLVEELLQTYDQLLAGKNAAASAEEKYEDYIRYLERRDQEEEMLYWKEYLASAGSGTLLPFISATAERTKGKGVYEVQELQLTGVKAKQLLSYAQQHRITVNTVVQAVWAYLLYRYTGQQQVTYGVTVSGRPDDLPGVEKRVGMYINTLPFHTVIDREQGIAPWLQQIQQQQVQSREHQYTSLNDIQRWLEIPGDLFDNFLVFENYPVSDLLNTHQWQLQMDNIEMRDHANYPLGIAAVVGESVEVRFKYNTALLDRAYVTALLGHFRQVLEFMVDHPAAKTGDIILLDKQEQEHIAVDFNATPVAYNGAGKTIIDLFRERVAAAPESTALLFEEQALSYHELDIRSNQLAHYLTGKGVQPETLVPVCLERSPEMIISILGILKAGGAYLPIDPSYPAARITYLLEDSRATMLITSLALAGELDIPSSVNIIRADADRRAISTQPTTAPVAVPAPHHLAYVIYTSGSTGNPKGVMIEHKSVVNLALSQAASLRLIPGMRTLQFAAFGFDASCYEIFNTLLSGGSLVLPRKEDLLAADRFGDMVRKHQVELVVLPPSYQHTIREELGTIKTIVSAGEPLNREDAKYFQSIGIRVINAYGPTENTVCTSLTDNPLRGDTIVIGEPVGGVQVYILDQHRELCPVGITGEICAGGEGVARGYLYRPELTADKFIPDTFSGKQNARLYRTGDLGRWLPDGSIEYLGRIDDQVKIRGYRIELGEIENALEQFDGVSQAVVVAKGATDNRTLVAYILPDGTFDRQALSAYLEAKLPEYMVPSLFIKIDRIPVTPNGKVDRKALPDPDAGALSENAYVAPRNETEEILAEIWQQLLEVEQVGIHDDFFALGGHSLLSIRLIAAIRRKLGKEIALSNIFDAPTVAALAASLMAPEAGEETAAATGEHHVIPLNKSNSRTTVFIIPGQDGLSDGYDELAKALTTTAAVYGIQMPGVLEGERPLYTITEIAAQNIRWIKALQPHGPYRFIAHSFGAYVLYEMVRQLEAAGETVAFAALLDADAHPGHIDVLNGGATTYQDIFFESVVEVLTENNIITGTPPAWVTALQSLVRPLEMKAVAPFISNYLKGRINDDKLAHVDFIMRLTDIKVSNIEVLNSYQVEGRTNAVLHIVKAAGAQWKGKPESLGWDAHAKVTVHTVEGDHFSMLKQENAGALAQYLSKQLSAQ